MILNECFIRVKVYFRYNSKVLTLSVLLVGCESGNKKDDSSVSVSFENTQKVEVISSNNSDITTISDDNDIKNFVYKLKIDEWDLEDIPSGDTEGKTFKIYQKDTVKPVESKDQTDDLNEVATMITYKDVPNLVKSISFSFKIPKDVAEYLNSNQY